MDRRAIILKIIQSAGKTKTAPAPSDSLFDSGLLDSFALTDVIAELEQAFAIKIPDSDLNPRKFDSIERIEAYLDSRLG
jgi:acyl carrier protein